MMSEKTLEREIAITERRLTKLRAALQHLREKPAKTAMRLVKTKKSGKGRLSAAGRAAIQKAARKRWAQYRSAKAKKASR